MAFDLDAEMVERARVRLSGRFPRLSFAQADVLAIPVSAATFDAVFDFGAVHLVPDWKSALLETRRVLKPGGRFYFEWVTNPLLRLPYPLVTEGLRGMPAPPRQEVLAVLERLGISVGQSLVRPRLAASTGWAGDLIGVGWRLPQPGS
jgi:ubiquinone/menaquinone biosynthesis C-methylase UbiE